MRMTRWTSALDLGFPPDVLQAIGAIVVSYSALDLTVNTFLWHMAESKEQHLGEVFLANINFAAKLDIFGAAYRKHVRPGEDTSDVDAALTLAAKATDARNALLHSLLIGNRSKDTILAVRIRARRKGHSRLRKRISVSELEQTDLLIRDAIAAINNVGEPMMLRLLGKP